MPSAIVLLSGGIDSAVSLYWAKREGYEPVCLTINYYERIATEQLMTRQLADHVGAQLVEISLPFLKDRESLVKEWSSESNFFLPASNLPLAYFPFKNIIFIGIAGYFAELYRADIIVQGIIRNDEGRFKDATGEYFRKLEDLMNEGLPSGSWAGPKLAFPLWNLDKKEVIQLAIQLSVPLELTWSCHGNSPDLVPCGHCTSCHQRQLAFQELSLRDPLITPPKPPSRPGSS